VTTETKTTCDACGNVCRPANYFATITVTPGSGGEVVCTCKHACSKACIVTVLNAIAQANEAPEPLKQEA